MEEEEYSDGIDNGGSLRYEKTQNRDIMSTIERINRSERFRDTAKDAIKSVSKVVRRDAERILREIWTDKHDSHLPPQNLSITVDLVPPVFKKVHPEGDTDTFFKPHKEYPFYYLFNLKVMTRFVPSDSDVMKDDEAWYGKWFMDSISAEFNGRLLKEIRSELEAKFNNVFEFPTLEDGNNVNYHTDRINFVMVPALKFNRTGEPSGVNVRFSDADDIANILVTSVAMALERIIVTR